MPAVPMESYSMALDAWKDASLARSMIADAQLLALLGLDYPGADIPCWVMTELGPLVAKGGVTVNEFKTTLEYVLEGAWPRPKRPACRIPVSGNRTVLIRTHVPRRRADSMACMATRSLQRLFSRYTKTRSRVFRSFMT